LKDETWSLETTGQGHDWNIHKMLKRESEHTKNWVASLLAVEIRRNSLGFDKQPNTFFLQRRDRLEIGHHIYSTDLQSIICYQNGAKGMVNTGRKKSHSKRRWFSIPHVDVVLSIKSFCPPHSKWNWCVIWKIPNENMKMSYRLKTPINPCTCVALIRLSSGKWPLPAAAMAPPSLTIFIQARLVYWSSSMTRKGPFMLAYGFNFYNIAILISSNFCYNLYKFLKLFLIIKNNIKLFYTLFNFLSF